MKNNTNNINNIIYIVVSNLHWSYVYSLTKLFIL